MDEREKQSLDPAICEEAEAPQPEEVSPSADAPRRQESLWAKARRAVVGALDQDADGTVSKEDMELLAEKLGETARRAAVAVRDPLKDQQARFVEGMDRRRREAELRQLAPVFTMDLTSPDFSLPKLIRIQPKDKRHADSAICQGSIGHMQYSKELRVFTLYPEALGELGLDFYPDRESEIYYVDPVDRDRYLSLDEYFSYLKIARVNELQKLAQDLGARHFRVTFLEQKKSFTSSKVGAGLGAKVSHQGGGAKAEHDSRSDSFSRVEIAAEMSFEGHAPVAPQLHYLQRDPSIQSLIALRMSDNPVMHQKVTISLISSSGIKVKDAVKIDAALSSMKIIGNATVSSEAQSEARRYLEYEIDF